VAAKQYEWQCDDSNHDGDNLQEDWDLHEKQENFETAEEKKSPHDDGRAYEAPRMGGIAKQEF